MAYGTPVGPLHRDLSDPAERRVDKRKALLTHADVMISAQQQLPGHAIDISSGGIGLICPVPINHGQEIVVRLALAVCGTERHMEITGCVCFCLAIGIEQFRVGLQFVRLDDATAAFIAAVCA